MLRLIVLLAAQVSLLIWATACRQTQDAKAGSGVTHGGETEAHSGSGAEADQPEENADLHAGHESAEHGAGGHNHAQTDEDAGHEAESGGHAGHDHADLIQLTPEQLADFGVELSTAGGGNIDLVLSLPGEVAVNADKTGHVLPKLPGVVLQVTKNIGDNVRRGDLMAVIDSRELAEAKSGYLAALERVSAAESIVAREQALFEKGVSPEQDYLAAKSSLRAVGIELTAAEQTLHAYGISETQLQELAAAPHSSLTRYEIHAPVGGRVLEKHVSLGEMVSAESELFLIADLSTVWVNLSISQKDLPSVREGQQLSIRFTPGTATESGSGAGAGIPDARARIDYIDALVAEDTRTATARVLLPNPKGLWRPGLFVSGLVDIANSPAAVLVPLESIVKFEGSPTVFVQDADGFEPHTVTVGRESATQAEILSGLEPGDRFVSAGAYMVKAEFGKSEAGHGH